MHRLILLLGLGFLSSCAHVVYTRHEYTATSPAPKAGGSAFRAEFMPQGRESGVALSAMVIGGVLVSEVGPYQMRIHAFGQEGDQRWFEIKSLRLSGPDNFQAPMEPRGFEGRAEFKPTQTAGQTRASLLLGPNIQLDDKKHRQLDLDAEVLVMRRGGLTRGTIHLPLKFIKTRRRESIFIITEIWHDMRKRDTMDNLPQALPTPPESP